MIWVAVRAVDLVGVAAPASQTAVGRPVEPIAVLAVRGPTGGKQQLGGGLRSLAEPQPARPVQLPPLHQERARMGGTGDPQHLGVVPAALDPAVTSRSPANPRAGSLPREAWTCRAAIGTAAGGERFQRRPYYTRGLPFGVSRASAIRPRGGAPRRSRRSWKRCRENPAPQRARAWSLRRRISSFPQV